MQSLKGNVEWISRDRAIGWAAAQADPGHHVAIELWLDDACIARGRADLPRADLTAVAGAGDFGFQIAVPEGASLDAGRLTVRADGEPLSIDGGAWAREGVVETVEGGLIGGWAWRVGRVDERVTLAICDAGGEPLAKLRAELPRADLAAAGIGDGRYGFMVDLATLLEPGEAAEGVTVRFDDNGDVLPDLSRMPAAESAPVAAPIPTLPARPASMDLSPEAIDAIRGAVSVRARP